jgi:hypothetical protein
MDLGPVRKPRIFLGKPVRWPDMRFGHLTVRHTKGRIDRQSVLY